MNYHKGKMKESNLKESLKQAIQKKVEDLPPFPDTDWFIQNLPERHVEATPEALFPWVVKQLSALKKKEILRLKRAAMAWNEYQSTFNMQRAYSKSDDPPGIVGVISSYLLQANEQVTEVEFHATTKPVLTYESKLLIKGRFFASDVPDKQDFKLILLADGSPINHVLTILINSDVELCFELPDALQKQWSDIDDRAWADIPIEFVLHPTNTKLSGKASTVCLPTPSSH